MKGGLKILSASLWLLSVANIALCQSLVTPSYVPPLSTTREGQIQFLDAQNGWGIINGLNKTTNGGLYWQKVNLPFTPNILGNYFFSMTHGWMAGIDSIYRTTDGGISWSASHTDFSGNNALKIKFLDVNTGWAVGGSTRIYKTTNGGVSWIKQHDTVYAIILLDIDFIDANNIWAVGSNGIIYYSNNGGTNWAKQNSTTTNTLNALTVLSNNFLWAVGNNQTIIKSTNGGNIWTGSSSTSGDIYYDVQFVDTNEGFVVGGQDLSSVFLKTTNGGSSWTTTRDMLRSPIYSVSFTSSTTGVVGGGAVLKTTDSGISWIIQAANAYNGFNNVYTPDNSHYWAVGDYGSIIKSTDKGFTWQWNQMITPSFMTTLNDVYFLSENVGWVTGSSGVIRKTTNSGSSWTAQSSSTTDFLSSIYFIDQNIGWACGQNGIIVKTTNGGNSWTPQTSGIAYSLSAILFQSSTVGFAVGDNGTMLKSTDGGTTWSGITSGTTKRIQDISFYNSQLGWACTYSGTNDEILKTTNNGLSWMLQYSTGTSFRNIKVIDSLTVVAITQSGQIYYTVNGGIDWNVRPQAGNPTVLGLDVHGLNNGVAIGGKNIFQFLNPPLSPRNLIVTSGSGLVQLKWNRSIENDFLKYKIFMGTVSGGEIIKDSTLSSSFDTVKTIIGLNNGTKYYFRITAIDSTYQESGFSNEVSIIPSVISTDFEYHTDVNTMLLMHMNEESGSTVSDASVNNNTGSATGTTIVNGKINKGRSFNGSTNFLTVQNNSSLNPSQITIEAWINPVSNTGGGNIVMKYVSNGYQMRLNNGKLETFLPTPLTSSALIPLNTWTHVAVTHDGSQATIYINGVFDTSKSYAQNLSSTSPLYIGKHVSSGGYFQGVIDELRISNLSRIPSEFNLQLPPKNLAAVFASSTVNLSWQNGGGAAPLMRYKIYRGIDSTNLSLIDSTTQTNYDNTGITSAGSYYYRISAVDSTGFEGAKSFALKVTTFGIVSWFPFNGNANDSTARNNGTISSSPVYVTDRFGKPGSAMQFDGVDDYITSATNGFSTGKQDRAFSFWIKSSNLAVEAKSLVGYGGADLYQYTYVMLGRNSSQLSRAWFWGWGDDYTANAILPNDRWIHIIYNQKDGVGQFYFNGVFDSQFTLHASTNTPSGTTFYIANNSSHAGRNFDGIIDDIVVYNRSLTTSEIDSLYRTGGWPSTLPGEYTSDTNTVLLLHMNEESGSSVYDVSGKYNLGSTTGTTIVDGRYGKARSLNGSSDYISLLNESNFDFGTSDFTLEAWIYPTSTSAGQTILSKYNSSTNNMGFDFSVQPGGQLWFVLSQTGNGDDVGFAQKSLSGAIAVNTWQLVSGVVDHTSQKIRLYCNGVELTTTAVGTFPTAMFNSDQPVRIGYAIPREGNPNPYYSGIIDEVRISNIARTAVEFKIQLPPKNLSASSAASAVNLSWQNGGGAAPLMRYRIYRGTDSTTMSVVDSTTQTSFTNTGLLTGVTYYYRVSAVDSTGFEGVKSYAAKVTTVGLVAYYPFTGNAGDSSGNANHGTNNGATLTTDRFGNANSAYSFNGTSNYIQTPIGTKDSSYAISIWINSNNNVDPSGLGRGILGNDNRVGYGHSFILANGKPTIHNANGSTNYDVSITDSIMVNKWYHIVVNVKNRNVEFYLDNIKKLPKDSTSIDLTGLTSWWIGKGWPAEGYFKGLLDDIRIYNREFSANEIDSLYHLGGWDTAPTITDFTPKSGPVGTTVTITGTNFESTPSNNIVFVGGIRSTVSSASANQLQIIVPGGISTSPITVTSTTSQLTAVSNNFFSPTFTPNQPINQSSFLPRQDVVLSSTAFFPHLVDLDNDGKLDIVTPNVLANTISISKNNSSNGAISFAAHTTANSGSTAEFVNSADFDNDGKQDIVVSNFDGSSLSVYRNTSSVGTISLAAKQDITVGGNPYSSSCADLDGDGKIDIVVSNHGGTTLSILKNTSTLGSISFASSTSINIGARPDDLKVEDVDGDGKKDIIVTGGLSARFSILRNTSSFGTISFASQVNITSGANPWGIGVVDFDNDGKKDIAIAASNDNKINIFRNTGTAGTVSFAASVDYNAGYHPNSLNVSDVNGDGKADIVVGNDSALGYITVLQNNSQSGIISFGQKVSFTAISRSYASIMGDIDGDGRPDVVVGNTNTNTLSIFKNITSNNGLVAHYTFSGNANDSSGVGNHGFVNGPMLTTDRFGNTNSAYSFNGSSDYINVLQLNGLSTTSNSSISFSVWILSSGHPTDINTKVFESLTSAPDEFFLNAKKNGDKYSLDFCLHDHIATSLDLIYNQWYHVVGTYDGFDQKIYVNGILSNTQSWSNTFPISGQFYIGKDLTAGQYFYGKIDDINLYNRTLSNSEIDSLYHLGGWNNPPTISDFIPKTGPVGTIVSITGINFNSIAANNVVYFGAVKAQINSASPTTLNVTVPNGSTYKPISVTDTSTRLKGYSSKPFDILFPSSGVIDSLSFLSKIDFPTGVHPKEIAIADVDGDGKSDIAVTLEGGVSPISIYRNTSILGSITGSSFDSKIDFPAVAGSEDVTFEDIDGDGKLDLIVGYFSGFSVYRNTSIVGSITESSFASKLDFIGARAEADGLAIGDLDGDGKPDVVITDRNANVISIFHNTSINGSISFDAKVDFSVGTVASPQSLAICDLDGDNKSDIIVANDASGKISIFRNTCGVGTITSSSFSTRVDINAGSNPRSVALGDLNGDGKSEIVVANIGSNTISIFQNASTIESIAPNSFSNRVDLNTGEQPFNVNLCDLDGDGKLDIVVNNETNNSVSVIKNISAVGLITSASFSSKVDYSTGLVPYGMELFDVDSDGKSDIVISNYNSNTFSVMRNVVKDGIVTTPQNLTASAADKKIYLKWKKVTDSDIRTYRIYGGTSANPATKIDSTTPGNLNDTVKTITGVTNGQIYYYRITAVDSNGQESPYSNEVQIAPTIVANGLVAYYPFNGNANDGSGGKNNPDSIAASLSVDRFGANNKTYHFNQNYNFIRIPSSQSLQLQSTGTIACWINIDSDVDYSGTPPEGHLDIIAKGATPTVWADYSVRHTATNLIFETSNSSGTPIYPNVALTPSPNQWKFVVASFNGNSATFYVDGIKKTDISIQTPIKNSTSPLYIGCRFIYTSTKYTMYKGKIDDVRIYNRALSAIEIDSLYHEGGYNAPPSKPSNLTALPSNNSVTLKWNSVSTSNLRAYKIMYGTSSGATNLTDSTNHRTDTIKTISGLNNNIPYYFRLIAIDSLGQSSDTSSEVTAVPYQLLTGEYIADNNTVLLLHFNETTGNFAQDVSGYYNHGAVTGTTIVNGRTGKARNFSGDEFINSGNSPSLQLRGKFTVEAAVKLTSYPNPGIIGYIAGKYDGSVNDATNNFQFGIQNTGYLEFKVGGNAFTLRSRSKIDLGKWYHVAARYDSTLASGNMAIYINGSLDTTLNRNSATPVNSFPLLIGQRNISETNCTTCYHNGTAIDEVRVSNIARAPQEFMLQLPPIILSAYASGRNVTLSWQNGGGTAPLLQYYIYRGTDSTSVSLVDSTVQTSYTNTNLTSGVTVFYRVSAVDSTGFESSKSFAKSATPFVPTAPPAAATLYTPVDGLSNALPSLLFTWSRPFSTERFIVEFSTDTLFTGNLIVKDTMKIDTFMIQSGLPNNSSIYWRVTALNSIGNAPESEIRTFTTRISTPVPAITVLDSQRIKIKWPAVPGASGYRVMNSNDGVSYSLRPLVTAPADSLIDVNLLPGTRYYYKVFALNSQGYSSDTSSASNAYTRPSTPITLSLVQRTDEKISISWKKGIGAVKDYRIYRSFNNSSFASHLITTDSTLSDSGLVSGSFYKYRVVSRNAVNAESDTLAQITVKTYPQLPRIASLSVENKIHSAVIPVRYDLQVFGNDTVHLKLMYSLDGGNNFVQGHSLLGKDSVITSNTVDTLFWNTQQDLSQVYDDSVIVKIVPLGIEGGVDQYPYSKTTIQFILDNKMPQFSGLKEAAAFSNSVSLKWAPASDNTGPVSYKIFRRISPDTFNYQQPIAVTIDTFSIVSNLDNFKEYYFAVRATDAAGNIDTNRVSKSAVPKALSAITNITTPNGAQTNSIKIPYFISVGQQDTVNILLLYSTNNFTSVDTAKQISGSFKNLTSTKFDTIIWNSHKDAIIETSSMQVRLIPVGKSGSGSQRTTTAFALDNKPPQFDGLMTPVADTNSITLSWNAASDMSTPVKYRLYKSLTPSFDFAKPDTVVDGVTWTFGKLTNFKEYYFIARAVDHLGNIDSSSSLKSGTPSGLSMVQSVTTPLGKQKSIVKIPFRLTTVSDDSVNLSLNYSIDSGKTWITPSNVLGVIAGIKDTIHIDTLRWNSGLDSAFRAAAGTNEAVKIIESKKGKNQASFSSSETKPLESNSVLFRIQPVGRGGSGITSLTNAFTVDNRPPLFNGLESGQSDTLGTTVTLSWKSASDLTKPISYYLYRSTGETAINFSLPADSILTDTLKQVTGLTPFVNYNFAIRAKDSLGNIDNNTVVRTVVPTRLIRVLSITQPQSRQRDNIEFVYRLNGAQEDTASITLYFSLDNGQSWTECRNVTGQTTAINSYNADLAIRWRSLFDATDQENDSVRVKIDVVGKGGKGYSAISERFGIDTKAPRFNGIQTLAVNDSPFASVTLKWNAAIDTSKQIKYFVYQSVGKEPIRFDMPVDSAVVTNWTGKYLFVDTQYTFVVRSMDAVGNMDSTFFPKSDTIPMLGDYDNSRKVDGGDIIIFKTAWLVNDTLKGDIGPATGLPPHWQPQRDHKVGFEDVMVLGLAWKWGAENVVSPSTFAKQDLSDEEESSFAMVGKKVIKPSEQGTYSFTFPKERTLDAFDFSVRFDTTSLRIDSVMIKNREQYLAFSHIDNARGLVNISLCAMVDSLYHSLEKADFVKLYVTAKQKLEQEKVMLEFTGYNSSGMKILQKFKQYELNWRPVVPEYFDLSQNYPNPFNPSTTVDYQLPVDAKITLKIYNILGQEIETLVNDVQKSGYYTVNWNGSRFATGVYIYRMVTKDFVETRKMLLIK